MPTCKETALSYLPSLSTIAFHFTFTQNFPFWSLSPFFSSSTVPKVNKSSSIILNLDKSSSIILINRRWKYEWNYQVGIMPGDFSLEDKRREEGRKIRSTIIFSQILLKIIHGKQDRNEGKPFYHYSSFDSNRKSKKNEKNEFNRRKTFWIKRYTEKG